MTGGTNYPFTFYASALPGSAGYNAQWRILWNAGGDTGYQTYTPGNNAYASINNSVTAPAAATSATIFFHFAGRSGSQPVGQTLTLMTSRSARAADPLAVPASPISSRLPASQPPGSAGPPLRAHNINLNQLPASRREFGTAIFRWSSATAAPTQSCFR